MSEVTGKRFHMIGIGGAGMSVIAELLVRQGAVVSGSDQQESPILDRLRGLGVTAYGRHAADQVPADATVVLSSAIRPSNAERHIAEQRGQEILHRSQALALASADKQFVAVAGAHGKTTTSAMITQELFTCGADPSSAIGGAILGRGTGAILGGGDIFVAEADESDGSFLNYSPRVAVVTNVEADHLDHFGSVEAFEDVFFQFASRIRPGGHLICCGEDSGAARLARRAAEELPRITVWTYGRPNRCEDTPTVALADLWVGADHAECDVRGPGGASAHLRLRVTGEHNLLNAGAAWAAGLALGFAGDALAAGLAEFTGTGRRFELRAEVSGRRLYTDYAHHPTEIQAALAQARIAVGSGRIIAVFQPHLYSRTANFADRFADALLQADEVVLADIYAAREDPIPGVTSGMIADLLADRGRDARLHPGDTVGQSARRGAELTCAGDILMLIGAGDIDQGESAVLECWERV